MRLICVFFLLCLTAACGQSGGVHDRAVAVATDDAAMNEAMDKARQTLPDFLAKADNPPAGTSNYALKVKIEDENGVEHFWVTPFLKTENGFTGVINNEPATVRSVRLGQSYAFSPDEVSDWMYMKDGKIHGGYTIRAMLPTLTKKEASQMRAMLAEN